MKGYEMVKVLSEGKKITTINGLFNAEYFYLRNRSELVFKDKKGNEVKIKGTMTVQNLFIGDDWVEYKDGFSSLSESITSLKRKEYLEIMGKVKGNK